MVSKKTPGRGSKPDRALAKTLTRLEAEARGRGFRITREMIAADIGVARSAVSGWFGGHQMPRRPHLEALARVLSVGDEQLRNRYRGDLFEAANIPADVHELGPMARARGRTGFIRIGVAKYQSNFELFFRTLITAFGEFCAFRFDVTMVNFKDLATDLSTGRIDLGANFFLTPDRLQTLRFVETPITIGLNAMAFLGPKRALHVGAESDLDIDQIKPIMNAGQSVYQYVQHVLGVSHLKINLTDYDAVAFADELIARSEQWHSGEPVPIVITDEMMMLRIQVELAGRFFGPRGRPELLVKLGPPMRLLGKNKPKWVRAGGMSIAARPRYNLALCVKRLPDDEWYKYIEDAWHMFLASNVEFLADEYSKLNRDLSALAASLKGIVGDLTEPERIWGPLQRGEGKSLQNLMVEEWEDLVREWLTEPVPAQPWKDAIGPITQSKTS